MKSFFLFFLSLLYFMNAYPQEDLQKDFPALDKYYKIHEKHSDFVILIDRSGTMKPYWSTVVSSLAEFIDILPEDDYVSVLGFDTPCDYLLLPRKITGQSKQVLKNELLSLALPTGAKTDLFNSANTALEELNRPSSNSLKFLFYFTDFKNDSPEGSKWKNDSIVILDNKYKNYIERAGRVLKVYALQLPLENNAGRDFTRFSQIFSNNVQRITFSDKQTLKDWFYTTKLYFQREKLKTVVESNVQSGVAIDSVVSERMLGLLPSNSVSFRMHNNLLIPCSINEISLRLENNRIVKITIPIIKLEPRSEKWITISSDNFNKYGIALMPSENITLVKEVSIRGRMDHQDELAKLNINPEQEWKNNGFTIAQLAGISYPGLTIMAAILFGLIYLLWRTWLKPEYLFGSGLKRKFKVEMFFNNKQVNLLQASIENSDRPVYLSDAVICDKELKVFPFRLGLCPVKPPLLQLKPRRGTYVIVESKAVFRYSSDHSKVPRQILTQVDKNDIPVTIISALQIEGEYFSGGTKNKILIKIYKN